jgi:hypothetical protein
MNGMAQQHTYRLVVDPGQPQLPHEIEFEAPTPQAALNVAHSVCGAGKVEVYEDGRRLAQLQLSSEQGFWIVR